MRGTGGMRGRGKREERSVTWGCANHVPMSSCLSLLTSLLGEVRRAVALLNPLRCSRFYSFSLVQKELRLGSWLSSSLDLTLFIQSVYTLQEVKSH